MSSYILYEGPSLLDGKSIAVIATGVDSMSSNKKTGPVVQTYILRQDISPTEAVKSGEDYSICGNCPHRNGTCYVLPHQGPSAVYRAYERGNVIHNPHPMLFKNRVVRLGAYGDPAAAPLSIWQKYTKQAIGIAGYTHQWGQCNPGFKTLCMASVDSRAEALQAQSLGWRTFRVKAESEPRLKTEASCPASEEQGKKLQCITCMACDGNKTSRKGGITINVHGAKWKQQRFIKETLIRPALHKPSRNCTTKSTMTTVGARVASSTIRHSTLMRTARQQSKSHSTHVK